MEYFNILLEFILLFGGGVLGCCTGQDNVNSRVFGLVPNFPGLPAGPLERDA
jgi:hypothetical protein